MVLLAEVVLIFVVGVISVVNPFENVILSSMSLLYQI